MHRESFFLPRYDAKENMVLKGHALAADAGIACITRRLVHAPEGYGKEGNYDFVGYFEFAEADASTFSAVMAALRDTEQNPEWAYISEGPEVVGQKGWGTLGTLEKAIRDYLKSWRGTQPVIPTTHPSFPRRREYMGFGQRCQYIRRPVDFEIVSYWAVLPPSITNSEPVTKDDSSEAR